MFYYFHRFLLSSCVCQLLIKFMMMMIKIFVLANRRNAVCTGCVNCLAMARILTIRSLHVLGPHVLSHVGNIERVAKHNTNFIERCRYFFHIELPSVHLQRRFEKFLANAADDDKVY